MNVEYKGRSRYTYAEVARIENKFGTWVGVALQQQRNKAPLSRVYVFVYEPFAREVGGTRCSM